MWDIVIWRYESVTLVPPFSFHGRHWIWCFEIKETLRRGRLSCELVMAETSFPTYSLLHRTRDMLMGKVNTNTATSYHQPSPSISITNDTKFGGMRAERTGDPPDSLYQKTRQDVLNVDTTEIHPVELTEETHGLTDVSALVMGRVLANLSILRPGLSVLYSRQLELALIISSPCPCLAGHVSHVSHVSRVYCL